MKRADASIAKNGSYLPTDTDNWLAACSPVDFHKLGTKHKKNSWNLRAW